MQDVFLCTLVTVMLFIPSWRLPELWGIISACIEIKIHVKKVVILLEIEVAVIPVLLV
jgi:hypothetical protein